MSQAPDATSPATPADPAPTRGPARGLLTLALVLLPAALAVALTPTFTTQDGPAHLYNARIVADAIRLGSQSPYAAVYQVTTQPVPNWAGHVATALAVETLPRLTAARAMTLATLVLVVAGVMIARWAVAGSDGLGRAGVLAALLGLNMPWLFGFTSFLLGAVMMPVTLALAWRQRDRPTWGGTALIAVTLAIGFFCHPISLAATVLGLFVLVVLTPSETTPIAKRLVWLALAFLPLVPLALNYTRMTRSAGGMEPVWEHLEGRWFSPKAWASQVSWIDPLSLAGKSSRPAWWPGQSMSTALAILLSPSASAWAGMILLIGVSWRSAWSRARRSWGVLAALLLFAGLVCPDTLGMRHGYFMLQRLTLLGLIGLVPWLDLGSNRRAAWAGIGLVGLALGLQTLTVWEYAALCRDRVGPFLAAGSSLPPDSRVGSVVIGTRTRFVSNPMMHADCLFGFDPPRTVWANYETNHYYFPVQVRPDVVHPSAGSFEQISQMDDPASAEVRVELWEKLLTEHHDRIDSIVTWGAPPAQEAVTSRWYEPVAGLKDGPTRTWLRRDPAPPSPPAR